MRVGGINTTERCNLSCIMCHFHGPGVIRRNRTLDPELVVKFLREIPPHQEVWLAGTGEFFMDLNAVSHLHRARAMGHRPCVLTNGQLLTSDLIDRVLEAGVRQIAVSVDAMSAGDYARIRRGGDFQRILDACAELRARKRKCPGLRVEVNVILFNETLARQEDFVRFWRDKADALDFRAEYFDTFKFRNTLGRPQKRVECQVAAYLLPSGQIAPCCAMIVHQHSHDLPWLPHIRDCTVTAAYESLRAMYADPGSPLSQLCRGCEWWIQFVRNADGTTPYSRHVSFEPVSPPKLRQRVKALLTRLGLGDCA